MSATNDLTKAMRIKKTFDAAEMDAKRQKAQATKRVGVAKASIKTILNVVVVVVVCIWLLQAAGLWANVTNFKLTR